MVRDDVPRGRRPVLLATDLNRFPRNSPALRAESLGMRDLPAPEFELHRTREGVILELPNRLEIEVRITDFGALVTACDDRGNPLLSTELDAPPGSLMP